MALVSEASELTLTLTQDGPSPPVLLRGATFTAGEGDDVLLSVPLAPHSGQPACVRWTRGGDDQLLGERYSSATQRGAVTLTVRNATIGDAGRYSVLAENDAGQSRSDLLLEVRTRPGDVPVFLRRLNDLAVKVGTRTRFLVEIRSPTQVKVSWEQEGKPVLEGERFHLLHEGNFFCVDVAPVTLEDAGLWMCRAHNANGTATCFCHLNVLVPKAYKAPHFIEELVALLTEQGTVSLECKVVGVPTPTLKWFKDNQEIKAGDVFALSANPEDAASLGTYTCEAINCMGRAYSTSRVHVLGRDGKVQPVESLIPRGPPPVFSRELQNEKVKIGAKLTLHCKVKVPPWPRTICWFNKAGQVETGGRYKVVEDGLGAYSVEVEAAEAVDEGQWKCVATSDSGVKSISSSNVTVSHPKNYKKPKFLESLKAILTEEGLVSFECKVVGFPTPQLRWFKDGQELKPGDVYQLTGTNSLGSYCCIARNCMGETSSTAELTVEDIQSQLNEEERLQLFSSNQPPRFTQGLKSLEAKINEPLRFTVQVSVSPQPVVSWYRDDEEVQESERIKKEQETKGVCHLVIKRLELADQAEWKCVATNDYGQSVTSCFLKLNVPRHYKKPRFLENLRAVLSEEGAVNLECKVIGVPQPTLKWYKDGRELKPGDIHRIISGQDGTCCLGTYTCEATNCMGTVASSASLLGFEERGQVKPPEPLRPLPPPAAHLVRHPSLSTILEERTSQMHDTITMDERNEVSFSFDGKEVSVSLYETPDLTEEEALQVVEMYAEELSEHISGLQEVKSLEHNVVELPPMRFVKETSTSGHLLMEAVVIDVSPEYYASAEDRTEADLDEFSITEDNNGFMSPTVLTPDEMPFEKFTADFLERSIQPLSALQKLTATPVKPPRKRGADASDSSYHSVKEAKLSPEEESSDQFVDALSSEKDNLPKECYKKVEEVAGDKLVDTIKDESMKVSAHSEEVDKLVPDTKKQRKKSRSRSKSVELKSGENIQDLPHTSAVSEIKLNIKTIKKRKSSESEKEDDSLQEFEKRKSLKSSVKEQEASKISSPVEKKENVVKRKSSESEKEDDSLQEYEQNKSQKRTDDFESQNKMRKHNKKPASDSSGREDDSLIEYERRKRTEVLSEKSGLKSERQKAPLSKSISTDSSEKDDAFALKSESSDQTLRKKKKKSVKKTDKKDQSSVIAFEKPPSSEAESIDRESFKGRKGVSTSDLDRMRSTSDLESIGDKSRAHEDEDRSCDFDTAEDSAYDKSEMSVLESLNHSIQEIQKGLAAVGEKIISESSEEPQSAKSSLSVLESLAQPISEIQRSLVEVERIAEETEAGQYSPSSILKTLKEPIEELGRNLAVIEQAKDSDSSEDSVKKTGQTLLETVGQPLHELQKELAFIQQQAVIETGEETYSEMLQSFKPSLLIVQGGLEQTERELSSKLDDITDVTVIPQATYAQSVEQLPKDIISSNKYSTYQAVDSTVPLAVQDHEGSFAGSVMSLPTARGLNLSAELRGYSTRLETCMDSLKQKAQLSSDIEIKDILLSTSKLIAPLEQFKTVIEKCLMLVVENDKSSDPQIRSGNVVLKAALESPVHALGNSISLIEAVSQCTSEKEVRGLGIKVLYKLSFPLEELKTTMKLVENLSEHTCIELLVAPVESLISTISIINPNASKVGFVENLSEEGVIIVRELNELVKNLSKSLSSLVTVTKGHSSLDSLSSLTKPLKDLHKNLHKLESKIKTEEKLSSMSKSEFHSFAQEVCKPLQAIRTELSLAQHAIELDQFSHLSFTTEPSEDTAVESLPSIVQQSLEQVYKSVLTCTEFVLAKSPDESLHMRYLLFGLNELILPLKQLNIDIMKAENLFLKEMPKPLDLTTEIQTVALSVSELLNALVSLQRCADICESQPESVVIQIVGEMASPLEKVENSLDRIFGKIQEKDKQVLNINMLKTLAEPFKCLQKSLINISSNLDSQNLLQKEFYELKQPIQELQRSILIIQDQVSFEYGDEPASIEANLVTLKSLVQPLNVLKKHFLKIEGTLEDKTQSTSYSQENKTIHSIIKEAHEVQQKLLSIMIQENYLNKHSLDSLDMFPIFQDLSGILRDFEDSLKRVSLVCKGDKKSVLLLQNRLTETACSFRCKVVELQNRVVLASNKAIRDKKHPVHFLKKGIEVFLSQLSESIDVSTSSRLDESSVLLANERFVNRLTITFKELLDFLAKMENFSEGILPSDLRDDQNLMDMSVISSSDTIKDINTIVEDITQVRVSLESSAVSSIMPNQLNQICQELQSFCDSLKTAEESIIENTFVKASSSNVTKEDERQGLVIAFKNMKVQVEKVTKHLCKNNAVIISAEHLKYALEVIQEHLIYGEEVSEMYVLQTLKSPLKAFKEVICKEATVPQSEVKYSESVSMYLDKFEKSTSDLELGLMKLEHALLNSTGDMSSLKNVDIEVIAKPIEDLVCYINTIEDQQSCLDVSTTLTEQSSLSMLKTFALPIREIQEGIIEIQDQIVLESSGQPVSGKSYASILYEIAKPIRELRSGVALIQEQVVVLEAEPISETTAASSIQTIAVPIEELKRVIETVVEEQPLIFEPDLQPISENISVLKTIAKPLKELQSKLATVEMNQVMEGNVHSLSVKENVLALAKPIQHLQECIATIESQIAFEASEGDISAQTNISVLKKVAQPLMEAAKCIAVIAEQRFLEEVVSEDSPTVSELSTLAHVKDISLASAALQIDDPMVLEQDKSLKKDVFLPQVADITTEDHLRKPLKGVQQGIVEVAFEPEGSIKSESSAELLNPSNAAINIVEEICPPTIEVQDLLSQIETLTPTERMSSELACIEEISPNLPLLAQFQEPLSSFRSLPTDENTFTNAQIKDEPPIIAVQVEMQQTVSENKTLMVEDILHATDATKGVEPVFALQGELQQSLADVASLETEDETLQSVSIQDISYNIEQNVEIQQVLSNIDTYNPTDKTIEKATVKVGVREAIQNEAQQTMSLEGSLQSFVESFDSANICDITPEIETNLEIQQALSNVSSLNIDKQQPKEAIVIEETSLQGAVQIECQQVLSNAESLNELSYSEKQSQVVAIEEVHTTTAIQNEILQLISVTEEIKSVSEELKAKVLCESPLNEVAKQEVHEVIEFVDRLQAVKEILQVKTLDEPTLYSVKLSDLEQVKKACESIQLIKETLQSGSVEKTSLQKAIHSEVGQVSLCAQSLQNIKEAVTENEEEKINETDVVILKKEGEINLLQASSVEESIIDICNEDTEKILIETKEVKAELQPEPVVFQPVIQTNIQQFISVAEGLEQIKDSLKAKVVSNPSVKESIQLEVQQILEVTEKIKSLKDGFEAKCSAEPLLNLATQFEIQTFVEACDVLEKATTALETKVVKLPRIATAIQSEFQQILVSADSLQSIKELFTLPTPLEKPILRETDLSTQITLTVADFDKVDTNVQSTTLVQDPVLETTNEKNPVTEFPQKKVQAERDVKTPPQQESDVGDKKVEVRDTNLHLEELKEDQLNETAKIKSDENLTVYDKLSIENITLLKESLQSTPFHVASQEDINLMMSAVESLESMKEKLGAVVQEHALNIALESHIQEVLSNTANLVELKQSLKPRIVQEHLNKINVNIETQEILNAVKSFIVFKDVLVAKCVLEPDLSIAKTFLPEVLSSTQQLEIFVKTVEEKICHGESAQTVKQEVFNNENCSQNQDVTVDRKHISADIKESTEVQVKEHSITVKDVENKVDFASASCVQEPLVHGFAKTLEVASFGHKENIPSKEDIVRQNDNVSKMMSNLSSESSETKNIENISEVKLSETQLKEKDSPTFNTISNSKMVTEKFDDIKTTEPFTKSLTFEEAADDMNKAKPTEIDTSELDRNKLKTENVISKKVDEHDSLHSLTKKTLFTTDKITEETASVNEGSQKEQEESIGKILESIETSCTIVAKDQYEEVGQKLTEVEPKKESKTHLQEMVSEVEISADNLEKSQSSKMEPKDIKTMEPHAKTKDSLLSMEESLKSVAVTETEEIPLNSEKKCDDLKLFDAKAKPEQNTEAKDSVIVITKTTKHISTEETSEKTKQDEKELEKIPATEKVLTTESKDIKIHTESLTKSVDLTFESVTIPKVDEKNVTGSSEKPDLLKSDFERLSEQSKSPGKSLTEKDSSENDKDKKGHRSSTDKPDDLKSADSVAKPKHCENTEKEAAEDKPTVTIIEKSVTQEKKIEGLSHDKTVTTKNKDKTHKKDLSKTFEDLKPATPDSTIKNDKSPIEKIKEESSKTSVKIKDTKQEEVKEEQICAEENSSKKPEVLRLAEPVIEPIDEEKSTGGAKELKNSVTQEKNIEGMSDDKNVTTKNKDKKQKDLSKTIEDLKPATPDSTIKNDQSPIEKVKDESSKTSVKIKDTKQEEVKEEQICDEENSSKKPEVLRLAEPVIEPIDEEKSTGEAKELKPMGTDLESPSKNVEKGEETSNEVLTSKSKESKEQNNSLKLSEKVKEAKPDDKLRAKEKPSEEAVEDHKEVVSAIVNELPKEPEIHTKESSNKNSDAVTRLIDSDIVAEKTKELKPTDLSVKKPIQKDRKVEETLKAIDSSGGTEDSKVQKTSSKKAEDLCSAESSTESKEYEKTQEKSKENEQELDGEKTKQNVIKLKEKISTKTKDSKGRKGSLKKPDEVKTSEKGIKPRFSEEPVENQKEPTAKLSLESPQQDERQTEQTMNETVIKRSEVMQDSVKCSEAINTSEVNSKSQDYKQVQEISMEQKVTEQGKQQVDKSKTEESSPKKEDSAGQIADTTNQSGSRKKSKDVKPSKQVSQKGDQEKQAENKIENKTSLEFDTKPSTNLKMEEPGAINRDTKKTDETLIKASCAEPVLGTANEELRKVVDSTSDKEHSTKDSEIKNKSKIVRKKSKDLKTTAKTVIEVDTSKEELTITKKCEGLITANENKTSDLTNKQDYTTNIADEPSIVSGTEEKSDVVYVCDVRSDYRTDKKRGTLENQKVPEKQVESKTLESITPKFEENIQVKSRLSKSTDHLSDLGQMKTRTDELLPLNKEFGVEKATAVKGVYEKTIEYATSHKLYIDESTTSDYSSESNSESLKTTKSRRFETRHRNIERRSRKDETDDGFSSMTSRHVSEDTQRFRSMSYDRRGLQYKQVERKPLFCGRLVDRTAAQGSKVRITCSLTGQPEPSVEWYKDGHPISSAENTRISTKLSDGLASLEIKEATLGDSGRYTCVARSSLGEAMTSSNVKIFSYLESAPEAPNFTQPIRDQYNPASDELVVECRVKGYPQPTIAWLKDGQRLPARSRYEQSVLHDGTCRLVVHTPEPSDAGLYKCVAENSVWSKETSAFVMFEGREKYMAELRNNSDAKLPRFMNVVTDHTVREGGTLALQVAVKGSPRAEVTWYRGSEPLPKKSTRYRYLEDGGVHSLVVTETSAAEAGVYRVRATNAHGHRDTCVLVQVVGSGAVARGKPAMFLSRADTSMNVAVGEDISISFRVTGDPKPQVTWMKNMKDITTNIRTLKETVNDYVRLTLKHATIMDSGTYFIQAKNIYGTDYAFVTVKVRQRARSLTPTGTRTLWSAPDTSTILRDIHESAQAMINDAPGPVSTEATVSDSGKNWVSLTWGKPELRGAAPVVAYRVEAWLLGKEGGAQWVELGLSPINSFDAFFLKPGAEYKFRVTPRNRYGWGESVTNSEPITIGSASNFAPDILRDLPGPLKALCGDSITLECEVAGDPAPRVQWLRDGLEVSSLEDMRGRVTATDSSPSHRLTITQLMETDSGRYCCEAVNSLGRTATYARLLVTSDPRLLDADHRLKA